MVALVYFDLGETHTPRKAGFTEQAADYWSLLKEPEVWGYFLCAAAASGAYFAFLGEHRLSVPRSLEFHRHHWILFRFCCPWIHGRKFLHPVGIQSGLELN